MGKTPKQLVADRKKAEDHLIEALAALRRLPFRDGTCVALVRCILAAARLAEDPETRERTLRYLADG